MDQTTDAIRQDIDATRDSMTDKLGQIESRVKGTVDDLKGSVGDTVDTVKQAFDLKQQVSDRPWTMLGASLLAGYVLGSLGGSSDSDTSYYRGQAVRYYPSSGSSSSSSSYRSEDYQRDQEPRQEYSSQYSSSRQSASSGMLSDVMDQLGVEMDTLKDAAIVTLGNMVRDMLHKNLPQFADEFERARAERDRQNQQAAGGSSQSYDPLERSVGASGTSTSSDASYQTHTASPTGSTTTGSQPSSTPSSKTTTTNPY